eukprot:m.80493 g.80493  ORF g.80493 m.80493 type:complete len:324 (-) comp8044_c0_seq1:979-1950(-)
MQVAAHDEEIVCLVHDRAAGGRVAAADLQVEDDRRVGARDQQPLDDAQPQITKLSDGLNSPRPAGLLHAYGQLQHRPVVHECVRISPVCKEHLDAVLVLGPDRKAQRRLLAVPLVRPRAIAQEHQGHAGRLRREGCAGDVQRVGAGIVGDVHVHAAVKQFCKQANKIRCCEDALAPLRVDHLAPRNPPRDIVQHGAAMLRPQLARIRAALHQRVDDLGHVRHADGRAQDRVGEHADVRVCAAPQEQQNGVDARLTRGGALVLLGCWALRLGSKAARQAERRDEGGRAGPRQQIDVGSIVKQDVDGRCVALRACSEEGAVSVLV